MARLVSWKTDRTRARAPIAPGASLRSQLRTDPPATRLEEYLERVAKYIPTEIIGIYLVIKNLSPAPGADATWPGWMHYAIYLGLILLNIGYLHRFGGDVPRKAMQIALGCIAFVVWTYSIGGPVFAQLEHDLKTDMTSPELGTVLLILTAAAFGLFDPNRDPPPDPSDPSPNPTP